MHCMIDLETLGVNSNAMILTFAAVTFDPFDSKCGPSVFYEKVDLNSYANYGDKFSFSADTLTWWMTKAPTEARLEAFDPLNRFSINEVMKRFCEFVLNSRCEKL